MICLSIQYHFKFFKGCLPQILLGPFLNTLTQMKESVENNFSHIFVAVIENLLLKIIFFTNTEVAEPLNSYLLFIRYFWGLNTSLGYLAVYTHHVKLLLIFLAFSLCLRGTILEIISVLLSASSLFIVFITFCENSSSVSSSGTSFVSM